MTTLKNNHDNTLYLILLIRMTDKLLFWGQIFEIEILKDLHVSCIVLDKTFKKLRTFFSL